MPLRRLSLHEIVFFFFFFFSLSLSFLLSIPGSFGYPYLPPPPMRVLDSSTDSKQVNEWLNLARCSGARELEVKIQRLSATTLIIIIIAVIWL